MHTSDMPARITTPTEIASGSRVRPIRRDCRAAELVVIVAPRARLLN
jgi:hypothetical protein